MKQEKEDLLDISILRKDRKGELHRTHIGPAVIWVAFIIVTALLIALIFIHVSRVSVLEKRAETAESNAVKLRDTLVFTSSDRDALKAQVSEQETTIASLSKSLNASNEELNAMKAEQEANSIPTLYPIKGSSTLVTREEEEQEVHGEEDAHEELMAVTFRVGIGSRILASADGIVASVEENGDRSTIIIDHDNGYKSYYSGSGVTLTGKGENISRGSTLMTYTMEADFTYKISYDGEYLDPMDMLEIDG